MGWAWLGHALLLRLWLMPSMAPPPAAPQFGKFNRIAYPGFNFVWCCIGERVAGGLSLRIQQLDVR